MPEGDTLFRTASSLRPALNGRTVVAARSNSPRHDVAAMIGQTIKCVESRGKHLLIHLSDGSVIHSHMGMTGSWHVYEQGMTWRKPERQAELVLETDHSHLAVCFTPKTIEILSATAFRRHPWLTQLGPDILGDWSAEEIITRFRCRNELPLGVAILDQRIVCGIGNVYKSELLFLERLNPFACIEAIDNASIASLLARAHRLMRRNLAGGQRRTRFGHDGQSKWVYRRSGEGCLKCGGRIAMQRQGDLGRSTYFCPDCQSVPTTQTASVGSP